MAQITKRLGTQTRRLVKSAGGDGQDTQFEQSFSNLAYAYLRDRAPSLLDYEVGFQLLDRNEDDTKSVGIFGFRVGSTWLYAPVFFLNGQLKGHELLYIKNEDRFVPLKENWLNYLLNRRPNILGEGVDRSMGRLGVTQPDYNRVIDSPLKYGSAYPEWAMPGIAAFAHFATTSVASESKFASHLDLPTFLKKAGREVIYSLVKSCRDYPKLGKAFTKFYDLNVVKEAFEACKVEEKTWLDDLGVKTEKSASTSKKLEVFRLNSPRSELLKLSAEEKEKLLEEQVVVKDNREDHEKSKVYREETTFTLTNPTKTGIYHLFIKPGGYEKCLIIIGPYAPCGAKSFATVVRLSDSKAWLNIHPTRLFVKHEDEGTDWKTWFDGLADTQELSKSEGGYNVLIGPKGEGTTPFEVRRQYTTNDSGEKVYDCWFKNYAAKERAPGLPPLIVHDRNDGYNSELDPYDGERVHLTSRKGTAIRATGGDLFVPPEFKVIKVVGETMYNGSCCGGCIVEDEEDKKVQPILPANGEDVRRVLIEKTAALKIAYDGAYTVVNGQKLRPVDDLVHLVTGYGLPESVARDVIKEAKTKKSASYRLLKVAFPGMDPSMMGPTMMGIGPPPAAPALPEPIQGYDQIMGSGLPAMYPQDETVPLQGANFGDPSQMAPPIDQATMQQILMAAQTGQKEVFDTTSIGGLLKAVGSDNMVNRHIGDLMKALDKLGRLMFSFYWHQEDFSERYGKSDVVELEDALRNAFDSLGEVTLFLKQKSVEPYPEETGEADIDVAANMS